MRIPNRVFDRFVVPRMRHAEMESAYLRVQFRQRYDIQVGLYSYGCFDRWRIPPGTRIGRYCSFARSVRIIDANHPTDRVSTHPFLYDPHFGVVDASQIEKTPVVVEDDVWLGHNVIVAPGIGRIGRGAIIGAGAVLTQPVAPYTIVAGVPARPLRDRFDAATIARLEASRWWEQDRPALRPYLGARGLEGPLGNERVTVSGLV